MRQIARRRPAHPRHRARRGFTLVELLVVIGVIALLISILLPALNSAQRQAQRVACAANLRSIGQAYHLYAVENNGRYPPVNHAPPGYPLAIYPNGPWGVSVTRPLGEANGPAVLYLHKFLPDARILYCPGGEDVDQNTTATFGNRHPDTKVTNLPFWEQAKQTGQWHDPSYPAHNQAGYMFWMNYNDHYPDVGSDTDPRREWFPRVTKDKSDRIMASDHMIRGWVTAELWNGHTLDKRKRVGTTSAEGFEADPNPNEPVTFEGGNILYNDGHVIWRGTTEVVYRMRLTNGPAPFDVFW